MVRARTDGTKPPGKIGGTTLEARKRGRPAGVRPRPGDLDILWQVYVWMTWPQNRTKSFDQLVHEARDFAIARLYPAADRTTLSNRLKRLHAAVAADPANFGFPEWVSRLPITGRRVTKPKQSGASRARIRRTVRDLLAEVERVRQDLKSQTRPIRTDSTVRIPHRRPAMHRPESEKRKP
jgi:hypothetical protein